MKEKIKSGVKLTFGLIIGLIVLFGSFIIGLLTFPIGIIFWILGFITFCGILASTMTTGSSQQKVIHVREKNYAREKTKEIIKEKKIISKNEINHLIDILLSRKPVTEEDRDLIEALRKLKKEKLEEIKNPNLCPHCGKYYQGNPNFCPNCGGKLKG